MDQLSGAARYLLSQPSGVRQFQQARMMFEVALARYAAVNASPADIDRLQAALEENRRALGQDKLFEQTDVAFHYVLAEIPRNAIFTALHVALASWLLEQRQTSVQVEGSAGAAVRAHTRIVKAIAARDPDGAEAAMRAHLLQVERYYWQARRT